MNNCCFVFSLNPLPHSLTMYLWQHLSPWQHLSIIKWSSTEPHPEQKDHAVLDHFSICVQRNRGVGVGILDTLADKRTSIYLTGQTKPRMLAILSYPYSLPGVKWKACPIFPCTRMLQERHMKKIRAKCKLEALFPEDVSTVRHQLMCVL